MKCCNCGANASYTIGGHKTPLCSSCHRNYQIGISGQFCSAKQVAEFGEIEESMTKYLRESKSQNQITTQNITIGSNNNFGILNTGNAQISSNDLTISSKIGADKKKPFTSFNAIAQLVYNTLLIWIKKTINLFHH